MTLYREDGEPAGIDDIVEWFFEIYPPDIFIKHPIAKIRDSLKELVGNR